MFDVLFLFIAGCFGGVINSIAGGGSFITFPALLFFGVPPISANATNTYASCSGYLSGAYAFRKDLYAHRQELPLFILISLLGGVAGAWLLMRTPDAVFREAIPWLLLFATLLFIFGSQINQRLRQVASRHRHASFVGASLLILVLLGVCVYGGFFNAGLGIIILSYLSVAGYTSINAKNGLKLVVSSFVSLVAIIVFIADGLISWYAGNIVLAGTLVGGYIAARVSRRLPQEHVRSAVVMASTGITLYFFFDIYI